MNDVPQEPQAKEEPELLTIAQITVRFGVSRQTLHTLRRKGVFPPPESAENSTRARWNAAVLEVYFEANPKQPGKKIEDRMKPPTEQGD